MKCWCCQLSPVIFDPFWTQTRKFLEFAFCLTLFMPVQFSSVTQLCPDYLRPNGVYHTRLLCPSPTSRACSNSCPSNRWWHPSISSSVLPSSSCLQSFKASGSFPMSQLFASGGQSIGVSASASVLPMNIQDWFTLGLIKFRKFTNYIYIWKWKC